MNKKQPFGFFSISFNQCLRLRLVVMLSMTGLFFYYVWAEKQIDAANDQRYTTRLASDILRQSTDDLTRMVRSYVVSGDSSYLQQYQDIIAIRDGKRPRPVRYDSSYRDYVTAGIIPKLSTSTEALPLMEVLKQAGFRQSELDKLTDAKIKSDKLSALEYRAIKLMQSAANDETVRHQAQTLVFDRDYHQQKANIVALIDEVRLLSEQRTQTAVQEAKQWAWLVRMVLIGLSCFLLFLIWLCEKLSRNTLGAAPETVYRLIRRLGNGQFDAPPERQQFPENSIMSHLLHTQRQLKQLEDERKKNQDALSLMSKVFSEAQEGIFLMTFEGTILDINSAFQGITGYSRQDIVGHHSKILKSDQHDACFFKNFWQQVKQEGHWRGEYWCRTKKGDLFASILSLSVIKDNDGNMQCYLGMLTDITQLKTHQQKIEEMAFHDPLTQLPNRPLLADRMQQALARVNRDKEMLAVACLDLDGFKAVNDQFGHGTGDALLIEVAHRLLTCVRNCDTVARLGGDEFAILLCEISSRDHCEITLQRVLKALIAPYTLGKEQITQISGSIGYTLFPIDNVDLDTLLRHADQAMYIAKQAGKNRFQYFDVREDKRIQANWLALARIDKALRRKEFCLYVQPKINLKTGRVVGAEALIRWQHPLRGLTSPAEFLPIIENNDISIGVGEWVIQEALSITEQWRAQGLVLPLSINLGTRQLRQDNFSRRLASLLGQHSPLPAGQLEIEIVESAALDDLQKVSSLIAECKTFGVNFALDDFGIGYSALTYLKRLSVSTLKIDQSFVRDLLIDESDLAIVRGIIGLAKAFKTDVVAKGVENWQQAACLLEMGCEIAQGYAIARPMPANDIVNWTRQFHLPEL
ncbi:MAG: EAL domain-containing protein [Methylomonas sp.]|jgi:diguanylate cyclase (GGDEF)-like protein/PAS domain S-box-containing protein|uniref:putative bifunctional diguanylate cyclase/phosphodiesterase n=1 Tax=Methylomonas sp. TaxID=418 RepID=UPI0025CD8745|nr:EAL domain-containing protein [Methylomonas sp.]MCK9605645.1 EAL domain-containing protein [Methylomonas sp.]